MNSVSLWCSWKEFCNCHCQIFEARLLPSLLSWVNRVGKFPVFSSSTFRSKCNLWKLTFRTKMSKCHSKWNNLALSRSPVMLLGDFNEYSLVNDSTWTFESERQARDDFQLISPKRATHCMMRGYDFLKCSSSLRGLTMHKKDFVQISALFVKSQLFCLLPIFSITAEGKFLKRN